MKVAYLSFFLSNLVVNAKPSPPTHYFIFGDKFSGVNHLSNLFNSTYPDLPLQECKVVSRKRSQSEYMQDVDDTTSTTAPSSSWRHGFFTIQELKKNLECDLDTTLFILTVKDVRSMLCSVARRKFKTKKLTQMYLNALIVHRLGEDDVHTLQLNGNVEVPMKKINNYLKMRTYKLKMHYSIISKMKHGIVTR